MNVKTLYTLNIKYLKEDEISEVIFRKLLDKQKFSIMFLDTNLMYHLLVDKEFIKSLPQDIIIIPSSKFVSFIISNLINSNNTHNTLPVRESSTLFKGLRNISDYNYRILVIERNDRIASRFKKHIISSIRDSDLNIIGIYNIFSPRMRNQKIETIRKIEPDVTIVGSNIVRLVKLLHKDKKILNQSSLIFSNNGVKIIAGFSSILEAFRLPLKFLQSTFILLWFVKEKIVLLFRGKR